MGVNPVGNQKYFTFDGESSKTYHTHITGSGVFNAPVRSVEMISIPGRNGEYPLDAGHFDNVELTYEASIAADTVAEFAQAVSDLRNWLCSKVGYCRLEDDYNPNEYRMAIYRSGLEVAPFQATSGTFDIVFDCKPQRFLKSGETAISVTSGDTITNPTRFEARPMLEVWGYGAIGIDNATITINNQVIGAVIVAQAEEATAANPFVTLTINFDDTYAMAGDDITFSTGGIRVDTSCRQNSVGWSSATVSSATGTGTSVSATVQSGASQGRATLTLNTSLGDDGNLSFAYGTAKTVSAVVVVSVTMSGGAQKSYTSTVQLVYDGGTEFTISESVSTDITYGVSIYYKRLLLGPVTLDSTATALGTPTYIDLDMGEAYMVKNDSVASLNNTVEIPAELPTLVPSGTEITYDNTITRLDVIPRWWQV